MLKNKTIVIFILLTILPFTAFAGGVKEEASSIDSRSETEAVPASDSSGTLRVVSLGPNITETIFALGKGDLLVGRTDYCDYPPEALSIQSIGSIQEPNTELIIALEPDLVIASTHGSKAAGNLLQQAGIDVRFYYAPEEFEGLYDIIGKIGADLGAEDSAEKLITELEGRYNALAAGVKMMDSHPDVYYVVGFGEGGDWTAGGDTFIGKMIESAGGNNIAADISGWSFSLEVLLERDPQIIIVPLGMKESFCGYGVYSQLTAVQDGRVFELDEDIITRQGPRLIDGLESLHNLFTSVQ